MRGISFRKKKKGAVFALGARVLKPGLYWRGGKWQGQLSGPHPLLRTMLTYARA